MSRKKKHAEHVNHERWLVSWADFMTLLFALFTALYAISNVDQKKANSMAEAARAAFSIDVTGKQARSAAKSGSGALAKASDVRKVADATGREDPSQDKPDIKSNPRDEVDPLAQARQALQEVLPKLKMHASITLKTTKTSIVVTLKDKAFFKRGSAKLLPGVLPVLDKIAEVLLKSHLAIRVEGHTDDQPSSSQVYTSNWDLSAARAVSVVRYFAEEYSYPPENLAVAGYASGRPVDDNGTEQGRQNNRRVDIILLADTGEKNKPHGPAVKDANGKADEKSDGKTETKEVPSLPQDHTPARTFETPKNKPAAAKQAPKHK